MAQTAPRCWQARLSREGWPDPAKRTAPTCHVIGNIGARRALGRRSQNVTGPHPLLPKNKI